MLEPVLSCGAAFPNSQVELLDTDGREVEEMEEDENEEGRV